MQMVHSLQTGFVALAATFLKSTFEMLDFWLQHKIGPQIKCVKVNHSPRISLLLKMVRYFYWASRWICAICRAKSHCIKRSDNNRADTNTFPKV